MSIWRGHWRMWAMAWAVFQLAAPPALSLIDGAFALRNDNVVSSHIEGHSTNACQPPHSADCAICQVLSTHAANGSNVAAIAWPVAQLLDAPVRENLVPRATPLTLSFSRAPPIA